MSAFSTGAREAVTIYRRWRGQRKAALRDAQELNFPHAATILEQ